MILYIAKSKYSKLVSSFLAFVIFFNNVIFPTKAFALSGGPSQPEFNGFDPAGSSEMVNLFTGDFSYNIPLMDVDGYPVNIAYHASPSMDQEASWVGLGWNLNVGSVNRNMRGLPDDFNGDPIKRQLNIEPYKAWGVSVGYFGELVGFNKLGMNFSNQAGMGVFHSNYSGMGIELSNSTSLGVSAGNHTQGGGLTAGLGVKLNSQEGLDIYPQLGISASLTKNERTSSVGVNVGCAINSRSGLKSVAGGFSISSGSNKKGEATRKNEMAGKNNGGGIGIGVGSSASIPVSSQGYMPKMIANMSSQAYSLDFKLGANACMYAPGGYISGYYATSGINESQKDKDFNAFGYLFSQNASDNDLLDFNREKDGMIYPEIPNLPISNFTYDIFSANAQGLNYAFRPHRNDIGVLRDNSTIDNSFGLGVGGELMVSSDINVGINVNIMSSNGESGRWRTDNDFDAHSDFTKDFYDIDGISKYEPAYFKVAGEKTDDDVSFLNEITNTNDDAYRVKISKKTNTKYYANNELVNKYSSVGNTINAFPLSKGVRAKRNQHVGYLSAMEAAKFGLVKKIESYPELTESTFTPTNFDDKIIHTSSAGIDGLGEVVSSFVTPIPRDGDYCGNRTHHISEMTLTQDNGSRYVYGIPLYNRTQMDAMFNIDATLTTNANATTDPSNLNGTVTYGTNDNHLGNQNKPDKFVEKRTLKDYSHGFLLTSVLSSDFVDRSGNGPSMDDYGDYTKFNYTQVAGVSSSSIPPPYKWRVPMSATDRSANFSQGLLGDRYDNKGVYLYGQKDLWYLQSIETKNYIAFFVLNDNSNDVRQDAREAITEDGGVVTVSNKARYLKQIKLYAKKDFIHGGIANAKPIKVVNFEYDYSLCPQTPNSTASVTKGKLTLKKIWFTYGNSNKGKLNPYVFDYADINHNGTIDSDENPDYNQAAVDRWGSYKPNSAGKNNLDFPYTDQAETSDNLNKHSAAWSLTQIKTPAGSTIKVNYEADDYAYVQNKEAGQMFTVAGLNNAPLKTGSDNNLYVSGSSREYLIIDLNSSGIGGGILSSNTTTQNEEFRSKYIKGLQKIYFRFKVHLDNNGNDEFVPGYAEIDQTVPPAICSDAGTYTLNGQTYYRYAFIKLKLLGINDKDQSTPQISPIVKSAFQMGRMYLPQIVFPGSAPSSGNGNAIKGLVTTIKDAKSIFKGINKALYDRKIAEKCVVESSIVRLYNPNGKKVGGGSRVSKITINDGWNAMSGESDAIYGQEYQYTSQRDGKDISSGVASYEPLIGGDENSMRYPVDFAVKKTFAPNDQYFQEEPMGESFFPDPVVGYSKVTVKNLPKTGVTKHATGRTEYEFFTAKDFPVVTDRTDLQKQRVKPKLLQSILKFGSEDKLYLSQGYVIKTNDMHGKPKSQKMFAENALSPISGIIYHYKTKAGLKSLELDNEAEVIDKTNTITKKIIGKTTDFYSDSRSSETDTYNAGVSLNIQSATCTYYVPLIFVWPSFSHDHREFHSIGTTKLIQQYGLVDYVEAFENNSTVKTHNLLYDDVTGEVLLTQTTNDFDDPVYNFKYPAYWAYEDMGAAFINHGIKIKTGITNIDNSTGKILATAYFRPGDELAIVDPTGSYNKRAWVVNNLAGGVNGNGLFLVDDAGNAITGIPNATNAITGSFIKILRSGRRNQQSAPMASLLSLKNPIMNGSGVPIAQGVSLAGGNLNATTATSVINSSAVEYSNEWHLLLGDKKGESSCDCNATQDYLNIKQALECIINHEHFNTSNISPITVYNWPFFSVPPPGNYTYPHLKPLIESFSWFQSCFVTSSWPKFVDLNVTKSITPSGSQFDHKLSINFTGAGVCSGSSCNIDLVVKGISGTINRWDNINSISNIGIVGNTDCSASNTFSFVTSENSAARVEEGMFLTDNKGLGTSCYALNSCTSNNSVVQCGKMVDDVINPYIENIRGNWRVKKSYSYLADRTQKNQAALNMNGNTREDGTYNTFNPFWKYSTVNSKWEAIYTYNAGSFDKWIKNNEVDKINEYGNVLQARDVLNRPSASLYGYNHTLPVAAANNAYYNQLAFDGFEDYNYINNECSASLLGNTPTTNSSGYIEHFNYYIYKSNLTNTESHTGRYSLQVPANSILSVARKLTNPSPTGTNDEVPYKIKEKDNYGMFGPFYNYSQSQKFVLSVWAKENVPANINSTSSVMSYPSVGVSVSLNGNYSNATPKTSAIINGWQKLEYVFIVPANTPNGTSNNGNMVVSLINNGSNTVFYDDIRIHPFNSSMKSMVYDPYSLRLMAELDDRNFATFYEYDEEGTLVRIKKETEKGIYTIKESRSGLKK